MARTGGPCTLTAAAKAREPHRPLPRPAHAPMLGQPSRSLQARYVRNAKPGARMVWEDDARVHLGHFDSHWALLFQTGTAGHGGGSEQRRCLTCRVLGTELPGFVTNDHNAHVSYVSTTFPIHPTLFTVVRKACVRRCARAESFSRGRACSGHTILPMQPIVRGATRPRGPGDVRRLQERLRSELHVHHQGLPRARLPEEVCA
jgi:hypothetical protein